MARTIEISTPQIGFQLSLLNLTASTAEAAGPTVVSTSKNAWKEEAQKVENLIEELDEPYVRVRRQQNH